MDRDSEEDFMSRAPRPRIKLADSVHQQLNMYALAAGAACACSLYAPPAAEAKIIYKPVHMRLHPPSAFPLYFNADRKGDFFLVFNYAGEDEPKVDSLAVCHKPTKTNYGYQCYQSGGTSNALNAVRVNTSGFASALKAGAKIQKGDRFTNNAEVWMAAASWLSSTNSTRWFGPWANKGKGVTNRYLGLKFRLGGAFHFGWARLTVGRAERGFTATLTGYAYETIPGKAIIAGATKEPADGAQAGPASIKTHTHKPATLGMLSLGAPGLSIWRREEPAARTQQSN
jgi:hypothetical protein